MKYDIKICFLGNYHILMVLFGSAQLIYRGGVYVFCVCQYIFFIKNQDQICSKKLSKWPFPPKISPNLFIVRPRALLNIKWSLYCWIWFKWSNRAWFQGKVLNLRELVLSLAVSTFPSWWGMPHQVVLVVFPCHVGVATITTVIQTIDIFLQLLCWDYQTINHTRSCTNTHVTTLHTNIGTTQGIQRLINICYIQLSTWQHSLVFPEQNYNLPYQFTLIFVMLVNHFHQIVKLMSFCHVWDHL